ncbi:MAG: GatB/YqeY domain-containing protein [Pseudomonadales bacterium]|nr:GatB/YqeY domain-containing protein [Pseudomonadales bacterium]
MSELKQRLTDEMKVAMRAKDKARLGAIRLMLSELKRVEVDERIELDDARIITILDKMLKQRRDSIQQFEKAERQDLADIEVAELKIIQEFMPAALSAEEIDQLIDQAIASTGASTIKDMGALMGVLKPQLQGKADMGQVSQLIKNRLN